MADEAEIRRANEDLSRLLRASIFPGAVSSFPKRSVTHEMLAEADPGNPEFTYAPTSTPKAPCGLCLRAA
jgi:hypothetical protein